MFSKSMFISHGFAIHITWQGERGRDQWGGIWIKQNGVAVEVDGVLTFKL